MKYSKALIIMIISAITVLSSCVKDLDINPLNTTVQTPDIIYSDTSNYIKTLAKCYAALTLTGQQGGSGSPDIANSDEGVTSFLRLLWGAEELSSDESVNVWTDGGLNEYHDLAVSDVNSYNRLFYTRVFYNIAVCNEFVRQVNPRVSALSGKLKEEVTYYLAEARFLRALYYYYAMDMWANPPFVDENSSTSELPKQIKRADLFTYIVSELKNISPKLLAPNQESQYYGRANRAAAWTLLAKCYLNSEVFTGTAKYDSCHTYCDSIINHGGYSLVSNYANLFLNDNNTTCLNEIIFPIVEDGINSVSWGGMTFIIDSSTNGDGDDATLYGTGHWAGNLTTSTFIKSFPDPSGSTDTRALFRDKGTGDISPLTVLNQANWKDGLQIAKFRNVSSTGTLGPDSNHPDTDFPLFRLADVYLMDAEALIRLHGDSYSQAVSEINTLRERAYGSTAGNVSSVDLDFIIQERGYELYWEAQRRTDLIRFGLLTTDTYLWDWKGGVIGGTSVSSNKNIFPIPATDITNNSNLVQNPL